MSREIIRKRHRRSYARPFLEALEARRLLADFGDAPLPYKTLLAENGASHNAVGPTLGANRDEEADGVHSVNADGDDTTGSPDDEDGVAFGTIRAGQLGAIANVQVTGGSARLDAWIDFNRDGSWGGPLEQVAARVAVVPGNNAISFDVPSSAADGPTYARFRLSTGAPLGVGGVAVDGEVEDYLVTILPPMAACGCFQDHNIATTANSARSVFAIDVDSDGDTDALSASAYDNKIAWYENDGNQSFTARTISTAAGSAQSVYAADVDGDDDIDVLSASADSKIAWYENDGNQNFTVRVITTGALAANSVFAADVDSDGDMDVLSASKNDDKIAWYENNGSQVFTTRTITTSANRAHSVYAADVDSDGDMDVLSASFADNKIAWYENNGIQVFTTRIITTAALAATSVYATDVDGDGDMDVLSSASTNGQITWYENDGNQVFTAHTISTAIDNAFSVYAADMDGDGDTDVLAAFAFVIKIAWYENDGNQNFTAHGISISAADARGVYAADVDGDGDLDVLSASKNDDKIAWYENLSFHVINANDSGAGSLRQAINEANAHTGLDTITFVIGTGVQTIAPTSPLPTITDAVVIDGTTQPGYSGTPLIELTGSVAGVSANGLTLAAGNNVVKGLVINSFTANGVRVNGDVNRIEGSFIGTDITGTLAMGNGLNGVEISGGSNNRIGGTLAGTGNIIAFNASRGIVVDTGTANSIRQNAIFANGSVGIALTNGGNNNQAKPFVFSAVNNGSSTTVQVRLVSTPSTTFAVELFVSSVCDPSGSGEGELFLQTSNITTNVVGRGRTMLANLAAPVGSFITATATSPSGDTSEFALCREVTPSTPLPIPPPPAPPILNQNRAVARPIRVQVLVMPAELSPISAVNRTPTAHRMARLTDLSTADAVALLDTLFSEALVALSELPRSRAGSVAGHLFFQEAKRI